MSDSKIKVPAHDGGEFAAYISMPEITPAPAIIMIQEIFGINQEMRDKCDAMADQGYIAIAPDLFWRIEPGIELVDSIPEELERAFHLYGQFDIPLGAQDLKSTLNFARNHAACNGQVGCIGYCLGGKLAYMLAAGSDINASVSYYGVGIGTMLDQAENIKSPILLHIAGEDEFVPKDEQEQIENAMLEHPLAALYRYPGMEHAFARGHGMHYNEEAATLANNRTTEFLTENLKRAKAA